jgi:hypothetical protein
VSAFLAWKYWRFQVLSFIFPSHRFFHASPGMHIAKGAKMSWDSEEGILIRVSKGPLGAPGQ